MIPGGMISQLQPPNVSLKKPFKDYLGKEYETWLLSEKLPLTPSGKLKRASASNLQNRSRPLGSRSQEEQRKSHSRDAALEMHLTAQKTIYCDIVLMAALTYKATLKNL
jgi:hypothetical protein